MLGAARYPALYIGLESVQIVQVQGGGKNIKIANLAHIDIFSENVRPSDEASRNGLIVGAIQKAMRKCKIKGREVNTVLPHGAVTVRFFTMPRLPKDEWETAIRFEAKKYIPFRLDEIISDYSIIDDEKQKRMKVFFAAAKSEAVKRHVALLAKAGIRPKSIDIIPLALIRTFKFMGIIDEKNAYAIVNINPGMATIVIACGGVPYFVRDVSLSRGEEWVDDETAQDILNRGISSLDERTEMKQNLVSELRLSFDYYQKELHQTAVSKIILCGEMGVFDNLEEFLFQQLNIPTEVPNVVKYTDNARLKLQPRFNAILPISLGNGLVKTIPSAVKIDLFHLEEIIQAKRKGFMRRLIFAEIISIILCFSLLYLVMGINIAREENKLRTIEAERPSLGLTTDMNVSKEQLEQEKAELERRVDLYKRMVIKHYPWTTKFNQLTRLIPDAVWLTAITAQDIIEADGTSNRDLVLAGAVYTQSAGAETDIINKLVSDFKADADFYQGFAAVNLTSSKSFKIKEFDITKFEIFCSSQVKE